MSTRTIIEINHDYLDDLERMSCESLRALLRAATDCNRELNKSDGGGARHGSGITTLATRHHSSSLDVIVNGWPHYAESEKAKRDRT